MFSEGAIEMRGYMHARVCSAGRSRRMDIVSYGRISFLKIVF